MSKKSKQSDNRAFPEESWVDESRRREDKTFYRVLVVSVIIHIVLGVLHVSLDLGSTAMTVLASSMHQKPIPVVFKPPTEEKKELKPAAQPKPTKAPRKEEADEKPKQEPPDAGAEKRGGKINTEKVKSGGLLGAVDEELVSRVRTGDDDGGGSETGAFPSERSTRPDVGDSAVSPVIGEGDKELGGSTGDASGPTKDIDEIIGGLTGGGETGGETGDLPIGSGPAVGEVEDFEVSTEGSCRSGRSVLAVLNRQREKIQFCYSDYLKKNRGAEGSVEMRFTILPNGKVYECHIIKSGAAVSSPELLDCIRQRILSLEFGASDCDPVTVEFGYSLLAPM